jgi:hypothetical protein
MNTHRTPPGGGIARGGSELQRTPPGGGAALTKVGLSGSQPNLTLISEQDNAQITIRNKRKHSNENEHILSELADLKKQMSELMSALATNNKAQTQRMNQLCESTNDIKNQVTDIRNSMNNIIIEQNNMKAELKQLVATMNATETRLEGLETDVKDLKTSSGQPEIHMSYENVIAECRERNLRAKNIIIAGIPEPDPASSDAEHDKREIEKITTAIFSNCPGPKHYFRLGKIQENKQRLTKVCFTSEDTALNILRNQRNVKLNNIKIYSDQTPQQRKVLGNLQTELKQRISNGESNLRIGYVKGVPGIMNSQRKKIHVDRPNNDSSNLNLPA